MSTLRVNNLQNTSTTDGGISIDTSGHVTVDGVAMPSSGPLSNRNLIINGAMQVAQRGTSTAGLGATNNVFSSVDRFKHFTGNTAGRFTAEQIAVTDLPGFTKAFKLSCTTADTSIAANEFMGINYLIEGQDLQQIKKGTGDAEALMMSFYVKGNASATYTFEISDLDNGRHNTRTFDVTTSWTKIEIPFIGDTTGVLDNDNDIGFQLSWWLHAGSDFTGGTFDNTNTWASRTNANRVSSSGTSFFDSTDRTFFITGVQLEVGSVATPFEHRSYGDELLRCERYYEVIRASGEFTTGYSHLTSVATAPMRFRTVKRDVPGTITLGTAGQTTGQISFLKPDATYPTTTGSHTAGTFSTDGFRIRGSSYAGLTASSVSALYANGIAIIARVDAEL